MPDTIDAVFETVANTAQEVRDALSSRRSYQDAENPSGDAQLAADVYADELLEERLLDIAGVSSYASEEQETVTRADDGEYHVTCDPLDGSSNLRSNNGMGTIVGVYDSELPAPGGAIVAAGYVLYGPITTMVTATAGTVCEYLVENGERSVLTDDVTVPDDPTVYGFGGRRPDWTDVFTEYTEQIEEDRLKLRYGGAMIADINQVLTYGGIFGYPMLEDHPKGKLRLQFEGLPVAKIFADAGGRSSDGTQSLLSRDPDALHERSPVFFGTESLVDGLEASLGR
jgi:fructose-1,6-bisphosphatase I